MCEVSGKQRCCEASGGKETKGRLPEPHTCARSQVVAQIVIRAAVVAGFYLPGLPESLPTWPSSGSEPFAYISPLSLNNRRLARAHSARSHLSLG